MTEQQLPEPVTLPEHCRGMEQRDFGRGRRRGGDLTMNAITEILGQVHARTEQAVTLAAAIVDAANEAVDDTEATQ